MNTLKSHIRSLIAISLFAFFASPACKFDRIATTAQLGGHDVAVRPSCNGSSTHSRREYNKDGESEVVSYVFTCGDTTVSIRHNILTVNGKSYGTINEHDRINVDYGKVRGDSEVRTEAR